MAFQAYANGDTCTSETPKEAAIAFFEVTYDPKAWPKSYKNITKKMISTLP